MPRRHFILLLLNCSYLNYLHLSFLPLSLCVCLQSLCSTATMQTVRTADTNEVDKLIFRESDNDRKVRTTNLIRTQILHYSSFYITLSNSPKHLKCI